MAQALRQALSLSVQVQVAAGKQVAASRFRLRLRLSPSAVLLTPRRRAYIRPIVGALHAMVKLRHDGMFSLTGAGIPSGRRGRRGRVWLH